MPFELHKGNVYPLVFWKGNLMKLEDAPKVLNKKYYSKYRGKEVNEYEWIVLNREGRGEEWGKKRTRSR